jgi:hypothetical protein
MSEATGTPLKLEGGDFLDDPCYYCGKPGAGRLELRVPSADGGGRLVHYVFCTIHVPLMRSYAEQVQTMLERGEEPPTPRAQLASQRTAQTS